MINTKHLLTKEMFFFMPCGRHDSALHAEHICKKFTKNFEYLVDLAYYSKVYFIDFLKVTCYGKIA